MAGWKVATMDLMGKKRADEMAAKRAVKTVVESVVWLADKMEGQKALRKADLMELQRVEMKGELKVARKGILKAVKMV